MARSEARIQLLTDILTGAVESGIGWFYVDEYKWEGMGEEAYAVITAYDTDKDDPNETHRVDLDVIARGLGVIRTATLGPAVDHHRDPVLTSKAGERMYMPTDQRKEIMLVDRTNSEDGDLDAIDYLAILECGLFGKVVYC